MITDNDTNFVYLSDLLQERYPSLLTELVDAFDKYDVEYSFLKGTKDIWAVDYMPIQVNEDEYVQFVYDPDYLKPKTWQHLRTIPRVTYEQLNIQPKESLIIADGGNIVKGTNLIIVADKILKENNNIIREEVEHTIKAELGVEKVIIIPNEPDNFIGHSDGMIRVVSDKHVLLNDYPNVDKYKKLKGMIIEELDKGNISYRLLPYTSYENEKADDATGCYINYLELKNVVFVPVFGIMEDELALKTIAGTFLDKKIVPINSSELAKAGGVLNCISWNILR